MTDDCPIAPPAAAVRRPAGPTLASVLILAALAGVASLALLRLLLPRARPLDVRSLAIHPASTTHSQLTETEQGTTGVQPGLVRLSVGLETIDDILADLDAGFAAAASVTAG